MYRKETTANNGMQYNDSVDDADDKSFTIFSISSGALIPMRYTQECQQKRQKHQQQHQRLRQKKQQRYQQLRLQQQQRPYCKIAGQPNLLTRFDAKHLGTEFPISKVCNLSSPTIEIVGYNGPIFLNVYCATIDPPYNPHPCMFIRKYTQELGLHSASVLVNTHYRRIILDDLRIQYVHGNGIAASLIHEYKRTELSHIFNICSFFYYAVRLCFEVTLCSQNIQTLAPVVSSPIFTLLDRIMVYKSSSSSATVLGGTEIKLFCEKVTEGDIVIEFIEYKNYTLLWMAYGNFQRIDVQNHGTYSITFKTPAYHNLHTTEPARVYIFLRRPSSDDISSPIPFEYVPLNSDADNVRSGCEKTNTDSTNLLLPQEQNNTQDNATNLNTQMFSEPINTIRNKNVKVIEGNMSITSTDGGGTKSGRKNPTNADGISSLPYAQNVNFFQFLSVIPLNGMSVNSLLPTPSFKSTLNTVGNFNRIVATPLTHPLSSALNYMGDANKISSLPPMPSPQPTLNTAVENNKINPLPPIPSLPLILSTMRNIRIISPLPPTPPIDDVNLLSPTPPASITLNATNNSNSVNLLTKTPRLGLTLNTTAQNQLPSKSTISAVTAHIKKNDFKSDQQKYKTTRRNTEQWIRKQQELLQLDSSPIAYMLTLMQPSTCKCKTCTRSDLLEYCSDSD